MRTKIALLCAALASLSLPQSAYAQPALAGTAWDADDDCVFDFLHFSEDGTANLTAFSDEGKETDVPATWALDGATLTVKFPQFPSETMAGPFDGDAFHVTYDWQEQDGTHHSDKCVLTPEHH